MNYGESSKRGEGDPREGAGGPKCHVEGEGALQRDHIPPARTGGCVGG